jgi:endoglucanase
MKLPVISLSALLACEARFSEHGRLTLGGTHGTQIVDLNGNIVQLRGVSTFNPPWFANCGQKDAFCYMADTMGATMVRIAMDANNQHWDWVDQATECGLYVLIDYHYVGARPIADDNAKQFFRTAAERFGKNGNVMYELFNEPADMAWSDIKSYHEEIIPVIRAVDPDGIIVCGTPAWSGRTGDVIGNEIQGKNIMYTKHFYAASHHDQAEIGQLLTQIPVFVTEWGICDYSGDGNLDFGSAEAWQSMMNGNNPAGVWVSWANWGWNDKGESCSYLQPGSCDSHNWGGHSASGSHVDGYLKSPGPPSPGPSPPSPSPSPAGHCVIAAGQNNGGTNLHETAESTNSADDCCEKCSSTSGCVGFTWVLANHECWLKSSITSLRSDPDVISGSVSSPSPSPSQPCTGVDDGSDLHGCIAHCPSAGYADCVNCCMGEFSSSLVV